MENISVLPRRELSILPGFSNLGRIKNPYSFSQFRYLRQNRFFWYASLDIFLGPPASSKTLVSHHLPRTSSIAFVGGNHDIVFHTFIGDPSPSKWPTFPIA